MQLTFQMKVPKQFPIYIPKNVEGIFVDVAGPEASGSVLADCQPIGRDSEPCSILGMIGFYVRCGRPIQVTFVGTVLWELL